MTDVPEILDAGTEIAVAPKGRRSGARNGRQPGLFRKALCLRQGQAGFVLVGLIALVAIFGPFVAPHDPNAVVSMPYAQPGSGIWLGADNLGRDVASRVLWGGRVLLLLALIAATLGVALGTILGLTAGYLRGFWSSLIMRTLDIVLSFPSLLLSLLFLSVLGANSLIIVLTVAISHVPYVARVIESASLSIIGRKYVQYAEMIGVSRWRILRHEIFPGIIAPLTVQFGLRVTWSIASIASLAFLGFGRPSPAVDWGVMVNENQASIVITPLAALVPICGIALATIGTNLLADAFGQAAGLNSRRAKSE